MSAGALPIERLVAHRGLRAYYPENSLEGIRAALDAGIMRVECDVQFSRDGVAMLYHDATLERVSGLPGSLRDYSCAQLVQLPAGEPSRLGGKFHAVHIHPLADLLPLLKAYPNAQLFVEIKPHSLTDVGARAAAEQLCALFADYAEQVVLISFAVDVVAWARQCSWPLCGIVLNTLYELASAPVIALNPDYIFVDQLLLDRAFHVANCALPAKWVAYEVADQAMGWQLLKQGIALLESFDTAKLAAVAKFEQSGADRSLQAPPAS